MRWGDNSSLVGSSVPILTTKALLRTPMSGPFQGTVFLWQKLWKQKQAIQPLMDKKRGSKPLISTGTSGSWLSYYLLKNRWVVKSVIHLNCGSTKLGPPSLPLKLAISPVFPWGRWSGRCQIKLEFLKSIWGKKNLKEKVHKLINK